MTEHFLPSGEPVEFNPEAWDQHSQGDRCQWKEGPDHHQSFAAYGMANYYARNTLRQFLALPEHTVIQRFGRGEEFRAHSSINGAVVRFTRESFVLGPQQNERQPYQRNDFWGVVCTLPKGKTVLMRYFVEFADAEYVTPGFMVHEGKITAEVTHHQRYRTGYTEPDVLIRDKNLALYSPGTPVLEKSRLRIRLPQLRVVYRKPLPGVL